MRVLVCGSRTFEDYEVVRGVLAGLDDHSPDGFGYMVNGAGRGADELAHRYACETLTAEKRFPADWERHGKRAGYLRNQQMLDEGQPDLVVAFVDKPLPESKGTAMMVDLARKAGVRTIVVEVH